MEYVNKYNIGWADTFKQELRDIRHYLIFSLEVPKTANRIYLKIIKSILSLSFFPERYPKIYGSKRYKDKILRKLVINNYIILFTVDNNTRTSLYLTYLPWKTKLYTSIIILNLSNLKI